MSPHCILCNRSFGSKDALKKHLRYSPVHSFHCKSCDRSFGSEDALKRHLHDSSAHKQVTETPLDVFFRSFPTFDYDPSISPAASYAKLQKHEGWPRYQTESSNAWKQYQEALESELRMWYGAEDDLTAWHALCRAIGIRPLPKTCDQCEKYARGTHVNIVDLIECQRGDTGLKAQTFRTVEELRAYIQSTGKIFSNRSNERGNIVLRHLLRDIFRG